jgi:uncharacterized protein YndB with AHSA1/START domain
MAKSKPNELRLIRVYNVPVKVVWDAWVDPNQVANWWGPRGFTLTTVSKDVRTGGTWVYTMHGPDGVDYPNITQYLEVEKYSRLIYDHGGNENQPPLFRVTVLFTESKGKTTMDMTMSLATEEAAKQIEKFIKQAGGNSTWDRLAEYLEKESSGKENFVINRTFDTSIKNMFDVWTHSNHISNWLAPTGMNMTFLKSDIKEGSTTHYSMSDDKGFSLHGKISYIEISKPNRIVYTQQFSDEQGNTTRAPWDANWPETMLTVIDFTDEGNNQIRVTVTWEPTGTLTPIEIEHFVKEKTGMTQGWTGSFDKLEEYLKEIKF